ncbi:MAG: MotA/TolQ/ExbB proton channel family protein, partial [Deltaproteobacteria bacterium]|nr:MotA/TolQ/ExbB proton channel family protein [Deltaproteobacteria bacterium]
LISIGLMFLLHQLQQMQERYVLDAETYCDQNLIGHLYVK